MPWISDFNELQPMPKYTSSQTDQRLASLVCQSTGCGLSQTAEAGNSRDPVYKFSRQCILNAPKEIENVRK